jgi:multidrug efflux pump subunit AcrB
MKSNSPSIGLTGRFARYFIQSKLTPLIMIVTVVMGVMTILITSKEDEPSVTVTVADAFFAYPGRGAAEIDERIARPVSSWIREIPEVKHVVSSAAEHGVVFTVEFKDGVTREKALTSLYDRLYANADKLPPGVSAPLVKPRGRANVPSLAVSLWSDDVGPEVLRKIATEMASELRHIPNVSEVDIIGGQSRSFLVELDAKKLAERCIPADRVIDAVKAANVKLPAGEISGGEGSMNVEAGSFLTSSEDVGVLIVGSNAAGPIYLRDVAEVRDGVPEPTDYVSRIGRDTGWSACSAVTIAVTKVDRSNVTIVTREARGVLNKLAKNLLPVNVHMSVTRDSGETAVTTLCQVNEHIAITVLVAILLVLFALGWRSAVVTAVTLPITLLIIPMVYNLTGFTLNHMSLSALVFSIGLLIDNAIVVIENIHRHWHSGDARTADVAALAVQEIGPPTTLATLMVICALTPTGFVTGMVGQYLRPLPVGASLGMLFSLFIAFTITPYLCLRLFSKKLAPKEGYASASGSVQQSTLTSYYIRTLAWFMDRPARMFGAYSIAILLFIAMVVMIQTRVAIVRAMPDQDKDEISIMVDLPPRTQLEDAYPLVMNAAREMKRIPEVIASNVYVGTPGPVTFQGLARHYDFRKSPFQAEIHVQLLPDYERKRRSHEIALEMRKILASKLSGKDTLFVIAEAPPGVPNLSPLVAEVYGPDDKTRFILAQKVKSIFGTTPGVVDVDWTGRQGAERVRYEVDLQKASLRGVVAAQAAGTVRTLFAGDASAWASLPQERDPVPIIVRLSRSQRSSLDDILSLSFTPITGGFAVPATDIGRVENVAGPYPILRKDQQPVVMVTGVVTGDGPNYSAEDISKILKKERIAGQPVQVIWSDLVPGTWSYAVSWAGEWSTQRDLFNDLGVSFLVVLFLIYCLLVAWYSSFLIPVIIMLPIPLIIIGVIPAHVALGRSLDGVGTMGIIALAGIVIRNSILLVDFARSRIGSGMPVREAILEACEKRVRPIILTALAVILGEAVLYFDPILRGMGITLPSGALISTLLTLGIVPLAFYQLVTFLQARGHDISDVQER